MDSKIILSEKEIPTEGLSPQKTEALSRKLNYKESVRLLGIYQALF